MPTNDVKMVYISWVPYLLFDLHPGMCIVCPRYSILPRLPRCDHSIGKPCKSDRACLLNFVILCWKIDYPISSSNRGTFAWIDWTNNKAPKIKRRAFIIVLLRSPAKDRRTCFFGRIEPWSFKEGQFDFSGRYFGHFRRSRNYLW